MPTRTELAAASTQDVSASNSLADLAARIRAEHEAAVVFMTNGLERAINAGNLLIEAKTQLAELSGGSSHGRWLPWLAENCQVPERTAQAYMRVARSFGKLDADKSERVADLSFRDALNSLATTGLILKRLPPESYDRALASIESHDNAETWRHAVQRVRSEDKRAHYSMETPAALLPSPQGRKIRVARNPVEQKWLLAIGPNISRAALMEKEQAARETTVVNDLKQERAELLDRAAALEAEAKALREDANAVDGLITAEIKKAVGPALPFTETFDFQCDEKTDAELAGLPQHQLVERLLAARGTVGDGLGETQRGYWGDMHFMSYHPPAASPAGPRSFGWTKVGSPEWLNKFFPDLHEPDEPQTAHADAEVRS